VGRTLLIGHPQVTWREWLREHRGGADLLCLDPADPSQLTPGLLNMTSGAKRLYSRFYGSLDPQRQPHVLVAATALALQDASENVLIQTFAYRPSPVLRQTLALLAQVVRPDRILVAAGTDIDQSGFPVGPESVELERALPPMVQHAQRKAQWLKLLEECERHTVDLRRVAIEGARIGSGRALNAEQRKAACLASAVHAEVTGSTLLVVSDAEIEESDIARALDYAGCSKAVLTEPGVYRNLLCSFANQGGEDFGTGILLEIDWLSLRAQVLCTAVPPAPVRILRLGSLRVDSQGRELGETRPWQV
jgi:polynucleotide 5'-kinase involved in rRNA processing